MPTTRSAALAAALICVAACGKDGTAPTDETPVVTSVALDRSQLTFAHIGLRDTVRATAKDQLGRTIVGASVSWTSATPAIATVDSSGVVTSLGLGSTTITASAGTRSASVTVSVQAASLEWTRCSGGSPTVLMLIEAQYRFPLAASVTRYANDLCAEGYTVWIAESVPTTPPEIRAYLADAWERSGHALVGALLIGNIPRAYQYVVLGSFNPAIPDTKEEAISYQYYADVNGTFSASTGFVPTRAYTYDVHGGDTSWELWIGVLPVYKGSVPSTVAALTRYFDKNHAYRTGGPKPPRAFLNVSELFTATTNAEYMTYLRLMQTGTYSWRPFSTSAGAQFFFSSTTPALTVAQGYAALQAGAADFFVGESHGFSGAAGQLTIARVESTPVKTTFFWSSGCAIGDLDKADNFLTSVVYSTTSDVLIGKGTTNNSGGMGNNSNGYYGRNIATAMAAGSSFGAAILSHTNVPLVYPYNLSREFHLGTAVIVGDPTLKLRP
jgi:hypothetical protein